MLRLCLVIIHCVGTLFIHLFNIIYLLFRTADEEYYLFEKLPVYAKFLLLNLQ